MKITFTMLSFLIALFAFGQEHRTAISFPIKAISVDGNLSDWPLEIKKYKIEHLAFGEVINDIDLSAEFMVSYNIKQGKIYVAISVQDNDYISETPDSNINLEDRVLLYLDPIHNENLGSSVIFEKSHNLQAIAKKPEAWNPLLNYLDWQDVEYSVKREGDITNYEWSFNLGNEVAVNRVLGMDIIVADVDKDGNEAWMLWKPGTGKSETGYRLGEIILADNTSDIGNINGKLSFDKKGNFPEQLKIKSTKDPNLWVRTSVDSNGLFSVDMPFSEYEITPFIAYNSPLYSGDFNQKSRKLVFDDKLNITLSNETRSVYCNPAIKEKEIPMNLIEETGILLNDNIDETKIDNFIKTYQEYFEIPGVSIALIKDKKIIYSKAFGKKNNFTKEPLLKTSLFEAASITKSVFSMMVLKLAEDGIIDLDEPLHKYLPFRNLENDERYKLMTARHVLNHRSGLTNWPLGSYTGNMPDHEIKLEFTPGEKYSYSGEAMNYLGRVIEQLVNKPIDQIFREEINTNFNLENTYFNFSQKLEENMALGHYQNITLFKYKFNDVNSPASSLVSEADDFSNFVLGLMNRKYLSIDSYDHIFNIYKEMDDDQKLYDKEYKQGIGYGFFVTESPVGKIVAHGGNNGDYDCLFAFIPEKEVGFVVFTNSNLGDEFDRLLSLFLLLGKSVPNNY